MKYILVTGSREFSDADIVMRAVHSEISGVGWDPETGGAYEVVVGDCPTGADEMILHCVPAGNIRQFQADWDTHGKAAGPIRNQAMVDYVAAKAGEKVCLSFWQTGARNRGTRNCVALALEAGIPVKRFWN